MSIPVAVPIVVPSKNPSRILPFVFIHCGFTVYSNYNAIKFDDEKQAPKPLYVPVLRAIAGGLTFQCADYSTVDPGASSKI
jgi:hypothetical protein